MQTFGHGNTKRVNTKDATLTNQGWGTPCFTPP
jgi:hypothetical protein